MRDVLRPLPAVDFQYVLTMLAIVRALTCARTKVLVTVTMKCVILIASEDLSSPSFFSLFT